MNSRLIGRIGLFAGLLLVPVARAESLVVATYNVENYTLANRQTPDGYRPDYPKPEAEKQALRAVIRATNADILALEEMGPKPFLDELCHDLKAEGLDYPFAVLVDGDDPDRHVALLAKRIPKRVVRHNELRFTYFKEKVPVKRGFLEATFTTSAGDLTVFAVHLKSKLKERDDDPEAAIRREGEATAIRDFILGEFPATAPARYLLLGDCNDGPASKPVERLLKRGNTTITTLVPAADSRGESWTYYYKAEDTYSRIDHILVSPALAPAVDKAGAKISDERATHTASDHRPVSVRINL